MERMAAAAYEKGLSGLAFTEHVEWMPEDEATGYLQPADYFAELEALRARYEGRLTLLAGAEVGNSHSFLAETRALLTSWPWDYVLGSVHWAGGLPGWQSVAFEEGMEVALRRYFEELVLLAEEGEYDVLAHFDLVRRDAWDLFGETPDLAPYHSLIRRALTAVVERGKGLEINTSPWGMGLDEPCPGLELLGWYRELGGELLVLGSDSHQPDRLAQQFDRAGVLARAAGFERLARFRERRVVGWTPLQD